MREKVSISLDKEILEKADATVDGIAVRNRSQAIEHALRAYFGSSGVEKAFVLLGRSRNIKEAHLNHLIGMAKSVGVKEILIAGGPNNEKIFQILGSGSKYGIKVDYVEEKELKGTAGSIWLAKNMLDSTFLVIAGDTSFTFDLIKMVEFHKSKGSMVTMGVTAVKLEDSTDSIILEGEKVVHFNYQDKKPTYMTNAGVYLFEPEIFRHMPSKGSLEKDVFPGLAKEGKLYAYVFYREWKHNE
ncbi:MAG: mannose-1-phosphate guanyltransferase [archaeon GW2011_AR3]|nr:MAG: mannose-1-phosphate guanyltransferase [archaeon GW2011_AR3]MBS3109597.1 hypothetical protein [Candidatus Woesearchaeota archaeon]